MFKDFLVLLEPKDAPDVSQFGLIEMYHSSTDPVVKETRFAAKTDLRVVIATVALGIGIDCPDVGQVVHVGPPVYFSFL